MKVVEESESKQNSETTIAQSINPIETIRVLHIDDEEDQQIFLKVFVESDAGIKVTSAKNASDALELVNTGAYDCLISDYDMPDMNGLNLAKKVRETSNIPIIIYTGRGSEEIAEKAFAAGVDDYIRKEQEPAHYQVVSKRIRQAVERKRSNESYRNLFDNASDAIYIVAFDGRIIDINEVGCRRLGYSKDELQGMTINQMIASPGFDLNDYLEKISRKGHAVFEATHITREGKRIPVEVNAKVIKYVGSDAILSFSRDISDRKRLEAQMKERLEALQIHALNLSKCVDVMAVAKTTYKVLNETLLYGFFGFALVKGNLLSFIPDVIVDPDWSMEYPIDGPGVCGRAVRMKSSFIIDDVRLDPDYIRPKSGYKYLSELVVPVKVGERVVAVINVEDERLNHFTRNDMILLEIFSEHVASALNRIELLEKTRRYLTRIEVINKHAARLAKLNTVKEVADYSFDVIRELLGFGDGCIGVVEEDTIKFMYARNLSFTIPDLPVSGGGITARAVRTGESQLVYDTRLEPDFVADVDPAEFLSELDVPVKVDDKVVAVINLEDPRQGFFGEDDREVVEALAERIGSAMGRIWLLESVSRHKSNLEVLHRHASNLADVQSIEEVAVHTFDIIKSMLGFTEGAFGVVDGDNLRIIYANPVAVDAFPLMPLSGRGITIRAIKTGMSQLVPDVRLDADFVNYVDSIIPFSELAVPVCLDGKVVALINLEKDSVNAFSEEDRRILEVLAEHVASAMSRIEQLRVIRESEKALLKSEERFRFILDSAPEGVTVNRLGKLVYVNQQFADLMGYTINELLQKNVLDITHENYRKMVEDFTRRRALGEEVLNHYEVELIRKNGSTISVEYSISRIRFDGDNASLTFIRDVTQRNEKRALQKKIVALHNHAHDLNGLQNIEDVAKTTLKILHKHLNCNLLSIRSSDGENLHFLARWGAKPIEGLLPIQGKGLMAKAAREKQTILVNNTLTHPDFIKGNNRALSELVVPILFKGELLGVLNAESPQLNAFIEDDKVLMEALADEAGSSIIRIRTLETERSYNAKLEALQLNTIKLSQSRTVDEALDSICEILGNIFGYNWIGIGRVGKESIQYVRVIGAGLKSNSKISLDRRSITVRAVKSGVTQLVPDTSKDVDYIVVNSEDATSSSELVVPIRVNERIEFVMNLESDKLDAFSKQEIHLIELLSYHFGSAVELIQRRERINSLHLHASRLEMVTEIDEIAKLTLNTIKEVLDFKISSFHIVKGDILEMIMTTGFTVERRFTQELGGPGLIPYAVRERRSVYVPDVTRDERYVAGPLDLGNDQSSEFVVPILIDGVTVAAINLEDKRTDGFTVEDRELVELLSGHVASTMQRIKHYSLIKASDERYRNLLDNSMDSVIVIQGTRIVYANSAAAQLRGYDSPDEIIGHESTEFIPEDEKKLIRNRHLGTQQGEPQPERYYLRLLRRDGTILDVENVASRISYEGKPAVLAIARDMTQIRKLEESLAVLHRHAVLIGSTDSLGEVSAITIEAIKSVMGFDLVSFLVNEGRSLRSIRNAGSEVLGWSIPISGKGITAKAARDKRTILVNDLEGDPDFLRGSTPSLSELATPVMVKGELVAVLNVESVNVNAFTEADAKVLETLAQHVASAFERIYRFKGEASQC